MNHFSLKEGTSHFEIVYELDSLPKSIIINKRVQIILASKHLPNRNGNFEAVKSFKTMTTGKPEQTYIRCVHLVHEPLKSSMGMKIVESRAVGKTVGKNMADKRMASLWCQTIRKAAVSYDCVEILLDVDKEFGTDTKSLQGKILDLLPMFALFKTDRGSSDGGFEAKNPLQRAVKDAQAALQDKVTALGSGIQDSVLDAIRHTLDKSREVTPELTSELVPRFKKKSKWTLSFTLDEENDALINRRSSGIRQLILLNFLRTEAEKMMANTQQSIIYTIEKPETSQHPNYQVLLTRTLLALVCRPHRRIIITAHVPALAELIPVDGARCVTQDWSGEPVVKMPDHAVLKEAMESLGVLSETGVERAKGIVLVEGKSDVTSPRHAARLLRQFGVLPACLEDVNVVPVLIRGYGGVKCWIALNPVNSLGLPWCVFLDSDTGGDPSQVQSIQKRKKGVKEAGRVFFATRKREVENYLCPDLIHELTDVQTTYTNTRDAEKIIDRAVDMKPDSVLDTFWPQMTGGKILARSTYHDSVQERVGLKEALTGIISMTY